MVKVKIKKLLALIEQQTRAEIMARYAAMKIEAPEYHTIKLEKEAEIRKVLYGESDLIMLGYKWDLIARKIKKKKVKIKR